MGFFYIDQYYLFLVIPAVLIALWAQFNVSSAFGKYSKIASVRGITGAQAAQQVLRQHGIYNVQIEQVSGNLTDHFDPRSNVIRLSDSVFGSTSVAAIGVACHEAGHAVQYAQHYVPIKIRNAIIPITNIGSQFGILMAILGLVFGWDPLTLAGIILFSAVVVFQLVTLPVEFNASSRALQSIEQANLLYDDELSGAKRVLRAAALTYVAALLVSIANLLRLILLRSRNRN